MQFYHPDAVDALIATVVVFASRIGILEDAGIKINNVL
jgi:hypothetical protein